MKYLLLGAGIQGTAIAFDLLEHAPDTGEVTVVDIRERAVGRLGPRFTDPRLKCLQGDADDTEFLAPLIAAADVVISAVTYWHNLGLAEAAIEGGAHFVDLGGNNDVVAKELALDAKARERGVTIVPDCGLSPGLTSILGYHLATQFDSCDSLRLRAGGLPQYPRPPLNYQLEFSVAGLLNEYIEPALVIRDGRARTVPSLSELEVLHFPAPYGELEAFQTSGGTSTLPRTLAGHVNHLDYKTIRYRGHCDHLRMLYSLGMFSSADVEFGQATFKPREILETMLERTLPTEGDDVVLVLIEADGTVAAGPDGPARRLQRSIRIIDKNDKRHALSAMARMTGYPVSIIAQMLARGDIKAPGAHPQELVVPAQKLMAELARRGVQTETWDGELVSEQA
ncbi:MAG: saccharopine dehydrogenase C-terminal domain-containing protein [Candidatus Krumholzibacteriia bacterium]